MVIRRTALLPPTSDQASDYKKGQGDYSIGLDDLTRLSDYKKGQGDYSIGLDDLTRLSDYFYF